MINIIFFIVFLIGLVYGIFSGRMEIVLNTLLTAPKSALFVFLDIYAMLLFWGGILEVCRESGLLNKISKGIANIIHPLFPKLKKESLALQYIAMNLVANMLSMGSAATPFGLKAMDELSILNNHSDRASDEMITFMCINASGICLIPTTIIGVLNDNGSKNPTRCIPYIIIISTIVLFIAIFLDKGFRKYGKN